VFVQAEDGIRDRNVTGVQTCALPISTTELAEALFVSEFPQDDFKAAVSGIKQRIATGEVEQVVPSQRMSLPFSEEPMSVYRALQIGRASCREGARTERGGGP